MMAGYQVHISKPIEPQELIVAVGSLVGRTSGGSFWDVGSKLCATHGPCGLGLRCRSAVKYMTCFDASRNYPHRDASLR